MQAKALSGTRVRADANICQHVALSALVSDVCAVHARYKTSKAHRLPYFVQAPLRLVVGSHIVVSLNRGCSQIARRIRSQQQPSGVIVPSPQKWAKAVGNDAPENELKLLLNGNVTAAECLGFLFSHHCSSQQHRDKETVCSPTLCTDRLSHNTCFCHQDS